MQKIGRYTNRNAIKSLNKFKGDVTSLKELALSLAKRDY